MEFDKLGKYTIVGRIGTGSMGQVYKATDPILKREVAVKTMAASAATDNQLVQRFHREAQSAARLNHPNIITVFDFGEEQGQLYMAMELLRGHDLKDLLGSPRLSSLRAKLDILEQILEGVAFAHAQGVIHRDLKPGNIHVQPNGRVKILDFGLARPEESEMTQAGMVMGTPNYMSPEQVRGLKAGPSADVFALGAVAYEVLCGRRAFRAETMHKILQCVLSTDPQPLRERVPGLPETVSRWVETALQKDPSRRFEDAGQMLDALRATRSGLTSEQLEYGAVAIDSERTFDATIATGAPMTIAEDAVTAARQGVIRAESPESQAATARAPVARAARPRTPQAPTLSGGATTTIGDTGPSRVLLYVGSALVVFAIITAVALYTIGTDKGTGADPNRDVAREQVGILTEAVVAGQLDLARLELEGKNYQAAIDEAETALELAPDNAEASSIVSSAREKLVDLARVAAEARAAFQRGDTDAASIALGQVLALDPRHPVAGELTSALNEHFKAQAVEAQSAMERAQSLARRAEATRADGYSQAEALAREASALLENQQYAVATQKLLEARDAYERANRTAAAEREEQVRRQAADRAAQAEAARSAAVRQAQAKPSPATQPATSAPPSAAPSAAPSVAPAPTATTVVAPAQSTTTNPETGVRQVIADYERAFEGQDLGLFRQAKPNLSGQEEKRLKQAFKATKSQDVGIEIQSVQITGDRAVVRVKRQDTINGRRTPEVEQTFNLARHSGRWVIDSIGQ
jgi:tetratricopeptide (TPR) repeat protein